MTLNLPTVALFTKLLAFANLHLCILQDLTSTLCLSILRLRFFRPFCRISSSRLLCPPLRPPLPTCLLRSMMTLRHQKQPSPGPIAATRTRLSIPRLEISGDWMAKNVNRSLHSPSPIARSLSVPEGSMIEMYPSAVPFAMIILCVLVHFLLLLFLAMAHLYSYRKDLYYLTDLKEVEALDW